MLFFRSEEALDHWLVARQVRRGAVLSLPKLWELSRHWYQDRISPDYHGRTADQVQEIFRLTGLTSEYWQTG